MYRYALLLLTLLTCGFAAASDSPQSKTVIGIKNKNLYDGANDLLAGDVESGVRLTRLGLAAAGSNRERKIAHSNLCAGYLMLQQYLTALEHCNAALELDARHWRSYNNRALVYLALERYEESEADIRRGQALNPRSEKLKEVKGMYMDEVEPVSEHIVIDDRRNEPETPVKAPP